MPDPRRFELLEMLELAARGMGRIETRGHQGTTMVTYDEIEAMACVLRALGFPALPPGYRSAELATTLRDAMAESPALRGMADLIETQEEAHP